MKANQMERNTGVRLSCRQFDKLDRMAQQLGTSRNRVIGILIDSAEVEQTAVVSIGVNKNSNAQTFHGKRIAVSA